MGADRISKNLLGVLCFNVLTILPLLVLDTGVLELWSNGVMQLNTPTFQYSNTPFRLLASTFSIERAQPLIRYVQVSL